MRVVVVGLGKSGTTALFSAIAAAMPPDTHALFEPVQPLSEFPRGDVLVKVLATPELDWAPFRAFDKRVFIVRDPRDRLVSFLLYAIYNHPQRIAESDARGLLQLIEHKEAANREVGLWQISERLERITGRDHRSLWRQRHEAAFRLLAEDPSLHRVRYERFVERDVAELSSYLGLALAAHGKDIEVAEGFQRVARTRGVGDWKNWFTPEDIDYFEPWLRAAMQVFEYAYDWQLSHDPVITPAHGSAYVRRLLDEHRKGLTPARAWLRWWRRWA